MTTPMQKGMNHSMNDPVTKAVVDNIMGNLPTKRPQVRCNDCDLDFTSQVVLDAHLQGARHAKQVIVCQNYLFKELYFMNIR